MSQRVRQFARNNQALTKANDKWMSLSAQLLSRLDAYRFRVGVDRAGNGATTETPTSVPEGATHIVASGAIGGGRVLLSPPPSDEIRRKRQQALHRFLSLVALTHPDLSCRFLLNLSDTQDDVPTPGVANLVFNRRIGSDDGFLVIPEAHFIKTRGYAAVRRRLGSQRLPWKQRRRVAFWRGGSTGGSLETGQDPMENHRVALAAFSLAHPDMVDARIGRVVNCDSVNEAHLQALGVVGSFVPPGEQLLNRYLVSIDGWAGEWEGLYWKLYSGSTVLLVESEWQQWYTDRLRPFEHYVPVSADLSDLEERIAWCRDHDEQCRAIAERAHSFVEEELTYSAAAKFAAEVLRAAP